jgi:hypothetical protein
MKIYSVLFVTAAILGFLGLGCAASKMNVQMAPSFGAPSKLGKGTVASYATFDQSGAPKSLGVVFSAGVLEGLPSGPSDGHHCFDADQNGSIDLATECSGWHEFVLPMPSEASRRPDIPFKWALFNWNPHGHIPPGVYDVPHFDVHFYIEPIENVFALERGTCGPEFLRCDQFARATQPVPPNYMHPDYKDVGAASPAMGNHLVDLMAPEFHGKPFTATWIYGVYEGRVIFYEEMVTLAYLISHPDACFAIKMPKAVALTGYYPTRTCIRYGKEKDEYTVSMEDFIMREASPPEPIPPKQSDGK